MSRARSAARPPMWMTATSSVGGATAASVARAGVVGNGRARARLVLLVLCVVAVLSLAPASASATVINVNLDGVGTGTVTGGTPANPDAIDCSNTGGGPAGPVCSFDFPFAFPAPQVTLTATGDPGFVFAGWSGDTGGTCGSGSANPCSFAQPFTGTRTTAATFVPTPDPPVATTDPASSVGDHGATLEGRVNPNGTAVQGCFFEYGVSTDYGAEAPCLPDAGALGSDTDDVPVAADTLPLEPGVTYHYRLVASNLGGAGQGQDRAFTTTGESCPNSAFRVGQGIGSVLLPDCMAVEMVSPPEKDAQPARRPEVSADGSRVIFRVQGAHAGTSGSLSTGGDHYVATRGASGWDPAPTTPPDPALAQGWQDNEPRSYSPDFSSWFWVAATVAEWERGIGTAYAGGLGGAFSPLSPPMVPVDGDSRPRIHLQGMTFWGASADRTDLFVASGSDDGARYLPGDPQPRSLAGADANVYVAHLDAAGNPSLELLARDREGKAWGWNCGAQLGGRQTEGSVPTHVALSQGAVSEDGSRVFFSTRAGQPETGDCDTANKLRIMRRVEGATGPAIAPLFTSECDRADPPCDATDGDDFYQGASLDGKRVYFMTPRQLADSDLDTGTQCTRAVGGSAGCDLYLYDSTLPAGERLIQVSAGEVVPGDHPTVGSGADVLRGTTAISPDGSHVYFVARGVLTADTNPAGDPPSDGQPNLYLYQRDDEFPDGRLAFVGTVASDDSSFLWGGQGTFGNRAYPVPATAEDGQGEQIGGDGHVLVFQSEAGLTGDDADGGALDVFRYDAAAETLARVSKAGPSGSDNGPLDVGRRGTSGKAGAGTDYAEANRWVSEDGDSVVFVTAEALLGGDDNGIPDAYLWRDGQLHRLPGGADATGKDPLRTIPAMSHDGSTIAYTSSERLLPRDRDNTRDVYVARVGGGYPEPIRAGEPCVGDACQGAASTVPAAGAPGSAALDGAGNVDAAPRPARRCRALTRRARVVHRRARLVRRRARRATRARRAPQAARGSARQTARLRRRARRLSKRARVLQRRASACRRADRGGRR